MEILTKETLDAAVQKCQENKNYNVIVVTEYAETGVDIVNYLLQFGCNGARRLSNPYVQFDNGSSIRMLSSSSTARGYKANLVLCLHKIFYNENSYRFRAMERNIKEFIDESC